MPREERVEREWEPKVARGVRSESSDCVEASSEVSSQTEASRSGSAYFGDAREGEVLAVFELECAGRV